MVYEISQRSLILKKCNRTEPIVQIPPRVDGMPVTAIADYAFSGCSQLSGVRIPVTVTEIGSRAFEQCYGMYEVFGYRDSAGQTYASQYNKWFREIGDVNGSSSVDSDDATQGLKAYTRSMIDPNDTGLSEDQKILADVNADGIVDSTDAVYILQYFTANMIAPRPWSQIL